MFLDACVYYSLQATYVRDHIANDSSFYPFTSRGSSTDQVDAGWVACSVKYYGEYVQSHLGDTLRNDLNYSKIILLSNYIWPYVPVSLFCCCCSRAAEQPVTAVNWPRSKSDFL